MIIDDYPIEQAVRKRYKLLRPMLDERLRRLWAAAEALAIGAKGLQLVSAATGLTQATVRAGIRQLESRTEEDMQLAVDRRVRKRGGGRKSVAVKDLQDALQGLMEGCNARTHATPLIWTCKSLRVLAKELAAEGYQVSYKTIGNLLHNLGYSFAERGDYKKWALAQRGEWFQRIDALAAEFLDKGEPVISVHLTGTEGNTPSIDAQLVMLRLLDGWREECLWAYPGAEKMLLVLSGAIPDDTMRALPVAILDKRFPLEVCLKRLPPGTWRWHNSCRKMSAQCMLKHGERTREVRARLDLVLPKEGPLNSL